MAKQIEGCDGCERMDNGYLPAEKRSGGPYRLYLVEGDVGDSSETSEVVYCDDCAAIARDVNKWTLLPLV